MNCVSNRFRIYRILQTWHPATIICFQRFKRWLCGRRFESNKEVEWETEGYFGEFGKSYYVEGIEKLENRWNRYIELKGEYIEKENRFLPQK